MKNKILVLGKGYLGTEFERHGFETWGKDNFSISYPERIISGYSLDKLKNYDVVINCIGKSNTRWCENVDNFKEALFVNGTIPDILSNYCNKNNIKFVHISTGCLYDDTTKGNKETDFISAHCNYTLSKWIGESNCNPKTDIILRPRLLFSDKSDKNNLLSKIIKFNSYVGDKLDSFTCTSTIVGATKELINSNASGIFNIAQIGSATISRLAYWCNIPIKSIITAEDLRKQEKLYLVNNIMNIDKLLKFYKPMDIESSIKLSYAELKKQKS